VGVLDEAGGFHLLTRSIGRASRRDSGTRLDAATVRRGFAGLDLPLYLGELWRLQRAAPEDAATRGAAVPPVPKATPEQPRVPTPAVASL